MFVLITVPHSYCLTGSKERMCDIRAKKCAKILANLLNTEHIQHTTIMSTVPRELVDVNREEPTIEKILKLYKKNNQKEQIEKLPLAIKEWNKFNNRIKTTIMKHNSQNIMLIDIHSFPNDGTFQKSQITIIDIMNQDRPELHQFVNKVKKEMELEIKLFKGSINYIQTVYRVNTYPLLIEFCEDETYLSNKDIKRFFTALLDFYGL